MGLSSICFVYGRIISIQKRTKNSGINKNIAGCPECGICSANAICEVMSTAISSDGGDDASGCIYFANAPVAVIGDKDVASTINKDVLWVA